jgi:L-ascorbate metabolism protein UlaG (beta-lactamase superfamily)
MVFDTGSIKTIGSRAAIKTRYLMASIRKKSRALYAADGCFPQALIHRLGHGVGASYNTCICAAFQAADNGDKTIQIKKGTICAILAILLLTTAWAYLFSYPAPPVDPAWEIKPEKVIAADALTVNYAGTATLLFSDGRTQWMIDGWFSRPGPLNLLYGKVAPDPAAISFGLEAMGVEKLAAVIPMHSHYDHAMDTPEVALRTGAMVYGSTATENICKGWGLPAKQFTAFEDRTPITLGDFTITPIESKHFQFTDADMVDTMLTQSEIAEPLVPPVSAFDYKLGKAYILHISHPKGSFVIVGSAGYIPGQLKDMTADVIFLGTGGIGSQTASYREQYWQETVNAVHPQRVIPIHWDGLTSPLDGPLVGEVRIAGLLSGGGENALAFLKTKEAANPQLTFATLPRFARVVLFP